MVIDAIEGYVVTNSHVVKSEENVKVTFIDGNVYDGEVKGVDTLTDIALLIKPRAGHALPWATLGDSDNVEVGDYAIALGNPLGLDNSVTLGIISNVHRTSAELGITDRRVDFVQTDCAINPGNSGGPLVNEFSEVVALNTAIRADAEGIGFAIPINTVKRVVRMLANGEKFHTRSSVSVWLTISPRIPRSEIARKSSQSARSSSTSSRSHRRAWRDSPSETSSRRWTESS